MTTDTTVSYKTFADYPLCHWFVAGHAAENSLPMNAHEIIRDNVIDFEEESIWVAAEAAFKRLGHTGTQKLFELGYKQAMSTDEIAEARDDAERDRLTKEFDKSLGLNDPAIAALADSIY